MAVATVVGLDPHTMEQKKFEYFSSINPMAKKIMQEREKIKAKHGSSWEEMSTEEQDNAIDNWMIDPHIRARYAMHRVERDEVLCYPKLLLQTGQKIVHFGEEDITWQDEHSAPFSWETKSQLEFSLGPSSAEQGVTVSQADSKAVKGPTKAAAGNKVSTTESRRPEEESSFWKISAERSRLEGEKADFHSLTPSQIKSLEKGEKPLPSYLRQETSVTKEPEPAEPHLPAPPPPPAPTKSIKQRAPKPPAPQPPVAVSATSLSISSNPVPPVSVSSTVAGWERSQSTLPSVSNTVDEMFSSSLLSKSPSVSASTEKERREEPAQNAGGSPTFAQFNTNNSILKTGFDFLDNW
uniref:Chromosome 1 open reading frame 198 n=1 Tax=Neogobius melanostomus TaxID=47308 RepID=A0A8C6UL80_9GOBI